MTVSPTLFRPLVFESLWFAWVCVCVCVGVSSTQPEKFENEMIIVSKEKRRILENVLKRKKRKSILNGIHRAY